MMETAEKSYFNITRIKLFAEKSKTLSSFK